MPAALWYDTRKPVAGHIDGSVIAGRVPTSVNAVHDIAKLAPTHATSTKL